MSAANNRGKPQPSGPRPGAGAGPGAGPFGGPGGRRMGPGGGHGPMGMGRPVEKPKDFRKSLARLLSYLRPYRARLIVVAVLALVSTTFGIVSPKIQGAVMDKVKDAFVARMTLDRLGKLQAEAKARLAPLAAAPGQAGQGSPSALRDFLAIPDLAGIADDSAKAEAARALLDFAKRLPPGALPAGAAAAKGAMTPEQAEEAVAAIRATGGRLDYAGIGSILLFLLGLYLVSSLFLFATQWMMSTVAQGTVSRLRAETQAKIDRLPLRYLDARPHGDLLSRVTNDVDTIASTLQQSIVQSLSAALQLVGFVAMMLVISPWLTLIVLATLPLYVMATMFVAKRSQKHFAAQQKELGLLSGHIEEMYSGHAIVKAYGMEERSMATLRDINGRLRRAGADAQFVSGVMMPLMNFIGNLGYVLISVVGGVWLTKGRLSLGDIVAFIQYARSFAQPITQTAQIANIIQSTIACAERVFEVLDEAEEEADAPEAALPARVEGRVSVEGLDFSYDPGKPLIRGLSLEARPGHTVAIVGPTGAGKTTLVNLLMRFHEIQGGSISIDGRDLRDMPRRALRGLFGMVLQDTWLFTGTIRENIAYGREGATEEEIVRAARTAHADHFIRSLPAGYDTVLDEEAGNISQGERQLLTIARAVLADPAILILDEATSSVDTRTELLIQKAMANLMSGRTSFVIAHRLSTIRDAELILVMDSGSIVEQGTHEGLLARKGAYAELYEAQFAGPATA